MAFVIKDRVKETTTTTGTGTLTLDGAATGFETFSGALGNTSTTYYAIASQNSGDFEVGIGTVGAGTLSRDTVISSSNSDALVNFAAGTKDVFVTLPASKTILLNDSGTVDINGNLDVDGGTIKLDGNYPTGTGNVALGDRALSSGSLSGNFNTAVGFCSLKDNTSGNRNTASGMNALCANTEGSCNTAFGRDALCTNTTASNNTGIGFSALLANTTGSNNVAVGSLALDANTDGIDNTALGSGALTTATTASKYSSRQTVFTT
jgi:hypothetical protein